jgi:hypothetical protein
MRDNVKLLQAALTLALTDKNFIGNNRKVDNAIDALTPKDTVTAVFKRLQGNAKRDFLDKKDAGLDGYTDVNRDAKIKAYVSAKFNSYMIDPRTSAKATELFNAAYPSVSSEAE